MIFLLKIKMIPEGLEARVLVCDPDNKILPELPIILHKRFSEGEPLSIINTAIMHGFGRFEVGGVEYTVVGDMNSIAKEVARNPVPFYSVVVYEAVQVGQEGSAGVIADVNKYDSFMPQMIMGKRLEAALAARCARAGVLYFVEELSEAQDQIVNKIFRRPVRLPNLTVVKIGGSAFDFDRQINGSLNLEYVCDILANIHQERDENREKRRVNRILLTVGAGQYGDIVKEHTLRYGHNSDVRKQYPRSMALALQANLENLKPHFGDKASLLTTGAFYYIEPNSSSQRIPLIGTAPHYVMARDGIPLEDSDTHTVALGEHYVAERVILIKRTDGIYDFDPYRGHPLGKQIPGNWLTRKLDRYRWQWTQRHNERHTIVTVEDILSNKFSREGTGIDGKSDGSTGHLIEDSALAYMRDRCEHVKEIVVVHIAPEEMHYPIGGDQYKHVVTGEVVTIDPQTGWRGVLEENIRNAFNGVAHSKIVRE